MRIANRVDFLDRFWKLLATIALAIGAFLVPVQVSATTEFDEPMICPYPGVLKESLCKTPLDDYFDLIANNTWFQTGPFALHLDRQWIEGMLFGDDVESLPPLRIPPQADSHSGQEGESTATVNE